MEVYLDNSATTALSEPVRAKMMTVLTDAYGNPSSLHKKGSDAEALLREAARTVADTLRCSEKEILFTSGGTEANNLALIGAATARARQGKHLITTSIEHPSVSETMTWLESQGFEVTRLPVSPEGLVTPEQVLAAVRPDTTLVSIMMVNNELGSREPVEAIGKALKAAWPKVLFHVDAVQAYGKYRIAPKACGIDLMTGSAHKIHGPKGAGFLYVADKVRLLPLIHGGQQQGGIRSGTENMPGIVGLGAAAKEAGQNLDANTARERALRQLLAEGLGSLERVTVNGPRDSEALAPHIVSATFGGVRSEVLLHALEAEGIYTSAGSACSSHKRQISPVLKAIGLGREEAESTLRFSLCETNTEEEIRYTVETIARLLPQLRLFTRR